jgi:hypothetical protein
VLWIAALCRELEARTAVRVAGIEKVELRHEIAIGLNLPARIRKGPPTPSGVSFRPEKEQRDNPLLMEGASGRLPVGGGPLISPATAVVEIASSPAAMAG